MPNHTEWFCVLAKNFGQSELALTIKDCRCRLVSDWLKFEHMTRYLEAITTQNEFVLFKKKKCFAYFYIDKK